MKPPKPKPAKPVKVRRMFADRNFSSEDRLSCLFAKKRGKDVFLTPVFVLPADAASYDAMVEQGMRALCADKFATSMWSYTKPPLRSVWRKQVVITLAAIGITKPATPPGAAKGAV